MITVRFYSFSKRENSTKIPTGTGTEYSCTIHDSSSIFFPIIKLNRGADTSSAPAFNYCRINDFGRYYWITNWTWENGLWFASLKCDVLASFKSAIGSTSLYVLRASNSYDGSIPDMLYPTKAGCAFAVSEDWNISASGFSGCFVVGVTSRDGDFGSLKYYVLDSTNLSALTDFLCTDIVTTLNNFDPLDASIELQKALIDPLSYIKSCVYIPMTKSEVVAAVPSGSISNTDVNLIINDWTASSVSGRSLSKPNPYARLTSSLTIPKHPQTASRGKFVNNSPFTSLWLAARGFGLIDLDTTSFTDDSSVNLEMRIDLPTGLGTLTISNSVGEINRVTTNVGVPIQLSQILTDYTGAILNGVGAIGSLVGGFLGGNPVGAVTGFASGVGSAVQAIHPKVQSIGSGGSYADVPRSIHLVAQFFTIADDDIAHNGRPLCQMVTPSSGYYLIQDGDVPISGTQDEAQEIKRYLETGFFYE